MKYPGGKNAEGTWQWICSLLPTHVAYAEPFAGSAAILRHKVPAMRSFAIDRDAAVVRWLEALDMPGLHPVHGCGIRWLRDNAATLDEHWLIYCDPPYPLSTRSKKKMYHHEMTDRQHAELLDLVTSLRAKVVVSSYASPLYEQSLASWSRHERPVITRGGTMRTEVLWCNFTGTPGTIAAVGDDGHRVPIVGRDFRERERIKRLVARWRHNYRRRPESERRAILHALLADEKSPAR